MRIGAGKVIWESVVLFRFMECVMLCDTLAPIDMCDWNAGSRPDQHLPTSRDENGEAAPAQLQRLLLGRRKVVLGVRYWVMDAVVLPMYDHRKCLGLA